MIEILQGNRGEFDVGPCGESLRDLFAVHRPHGVDFPKLEKTKCLILQNCSALENRSVGGSAPPLGTILQNAPRLHFWLIRRVGAARVKTAFFRSVVAGFFQSLVLFPF